MDKDIFYNGSGCVDPTAGRAIGGLNMFNPGDIVSRIGKNGESSTCVIIAAKERVYQFLYLSEEERFQGAYKVDCKSDGGIMYTDPFRVCWTYEEGLEYKGFLETGEWFSLREAIAEAIGMYTDPLADRPKKENVVQFVGPDPRDQQLAELAQLYDQARMENSRLLGRIDVYRDLLVKQCGT